MNVLLESGVRFHCTRYDRERADMPTHFTMQRRKHLRGKRLESVSQLGVDRIVDFRFGTGDTAFHLIVELYSQGNVVLVDSGYMILALLRSHQFDEDVAMKVGEPYPVRYTTKGGIQFQNVWARVVLWVGNGHGNGAGVCELHIMNGVPPLPRRWKKGAGSEAQRDPRS